MKYIYVFPFIYIYEKYVYIYIYEKYTYFPMRKPTPMNTGLPQSFDPMSYCFLEAIMKILHSALILWPLNLAYIDDDAELCNYHI